MTPTGEICSASGPGNDPYRMILECYPHPAYLLDSRGVTREANLAGRELLGPAAARGASRCGEASPGEPFPLFPYEVGSFAVSDAGGRSFDAELSLGDGARQFQVHLRRAPGADGKFPGILLVLTDITPRVGVQRELAEKHRELTRLVDQISFAKRELEGAIDCVRDMIVFTDEDFRVRRCNRSFQKFVGRGFLEVIGGKVEDFLRERNVSVALAETQEAEVFREDTGCWYHIRCNPFTWRADGVVPAENEKSNGNVVILQDVTERKRILDEIEANNAKLTEAYNALKKSKMHILQQEKMASIGQLAAGVAHEINNPMGFIASNLRTLQKYADRLSRFIEAQDNALRNSVGEVEEVRKARAENRIADIQGDIRSLIEESLEGAERVRGIVLNLKSFSRVDQAESKHADINECLESTIRIVWNEIKYKANLVKELGEIPLTRCYPQQINQVLMNLLVNAAQAIEKQGEIRVRSWAEDGFACVSVSDTGCGIPRDVLDRIFEPFYTTKEVGKGTGLGLSIAYDIVEKHGGKILVESELGKGSIFTVRIPLVEPR
ncbi:MAG: ATP-binding protein [Thermodesulfobacteriota bacterium]